MKTQEQMQQLRNKTVLERLIEMNKDEEWVDVIAEALDLGLDEVAAVDAFGSERQFDPRGDGRNGCYSIYEVEGID